MAVPKTAGPAESAPPPPVSRLPPLLSGRSGRRSASTQAERNKAEKDIQKSNKAIEKLTKTRSTDAGLRGYFKTWRTYQLSDHMPLWVELQIDFSQACLDRIK